MAVHNDPPGKLTKSSFERFLVNSPLKVITFLNATFFHEFSFFFSLFIYSRKGETVSRFRKSTEIVDRRVASL